MKHAIHRVQELLSINDSKTIQIIAAINKQIKRNNGIDMKHLLQIASNKLMITKGETYLPVSEVIITTVEPEYILLGEISENRIVKTPKTETFRFIASKEDLEMLRDRINQEIASLPIINQSHG